MILKLTLIAFLIAMFLFITFGVKDGFSHKVRLALRLGVVILVVLAIIAFFSKKIF